MAGLSFNDSVGVSFDADSNCFDCSENEILDFIGSGIGSGQAFGTLKVNRRLYAIGLASVGTLGSSRVNLKLSALTGITSGEVSGTGQLSQKVYSGSIASGEAFGITTLDQRLTANGIGSAEAFTPARFGYTYDSVPAGIDFDSDTGTFDGAEIWTQYVGLLGAGLVSAEAFGSSGFAHFISAEGVGVVSAEAIGTLRYNLSFDGSAGIDFNSDLRTFDGAEDWLVYIGLNGNSIGSEEAFGSVAFAHFISAEGVGVVSIEAFGDLRSNYTFTSAPNLSFDLDPGTFDGAEDWTLIPKQVTGIPGEEIFGTVGLQLQLSIAGVNSVETFGGSYLYFPITAVVSIESEEAFPLFGIEAFPLWTEGLELTQTWATEAEAQNLWEQEFALIQIWNQLSAAEKLWVYELAVSNSWVELAAQITNWIAEDTVDGFWLVGNESFNTWNNDTPLA